GLRVVAGVALHQGVLDQPQKEQGDRPERDQQAAEDPPQRRRPDLEQLGPYEVHRMPAFPAVSCRKTCSRSPRSVVSSCSSTEAVNAACPIAAASAPVIRREPSGCGPTAACS